MGYMSLLIIISTFAGTSNQSFGPANYSCFGEDFSSADVKSWHESIGGPCESVGGHPDCTPGESNGQTSEHQNAQEGAFRGEFCDKTFS